jgi:hypothetical protein
LNPAGYVATRHMAAQILYRGSLGFFANHMVLRAVPLQAANTTKN